MARHARFTVKRRGSSWRVEVPATLSPTGKRQQVFFKTRDAADAHAKDLREKHRQHGAGASVLPPSAAEKYVLAESLLEPFGVDLLEAVKAHVATLTAAAESKPMAAVWAAYMDAKGHRRETTLRSLLYTARRLEPLDTRVMAGIKSAEIEGLLEGLAPSTQNMHRRNISAVWRWASHPSRAWCAMEPGTTLEASTTAKGGEIEVLTPGEVETLLRTAEAHFSDLVPVYAILLFAGCRREEITRLQWKDITDDGIEVSADTSKKTLRRFIPWNDTLRAWLDGLHGEGIITPSNYAEMDKACRRLAGWNVAARWFTTYASWKGKEPPPLPADAQPWPKNAMRHTHASASVAIGCSVDNLIFSFGHSGGPEMLRRHYVGKYTTRDAIKFWAIGPKGTKIESIREAM